MGTDALDIEQPGALVGYLRATGRIGADEEPAVWVLAGGVSNRTVLVGRPGGEAWVVKQALAKLRVQVDWFSDPARIHREASGLRWLAELAPPGSTTPLVFEDTAHHILTMAAVPEPHANWKAMLLAGDVEADHVAQFGRLLGTVHRGSAARLDELRPELGDRGFFESLRLEPYYLFTAGQVPAARGFLDRLVAETRATATTITHGDYSPKNVLVREGRLILLDHEVIHLGDPAFDLGFGLTHLLSKAHHLPAHRETFRSAAARFWESYRDTVAVCDAWTDDLERRAVRHTLGCLLARARGRSPLEYLSDAERDRQAAAVVAMMADPPATVPELGGQFLAAIEEAGG